MFAKSLIEKNDPTLRTLLLRPWCSGRLLEVKAMGPDDWTAGFRFPDGEASGTKYYIGLRREPEELSR